MHTVLDLFSGIGGFSLGLERTGGFKTVAFCEQDAPARQVLDKHWPHVTKYTDIRNLTHEELRADGVVPSVICGGFPCQDVSKSNAVNRDGIKGKRSGLWKEMFRLVRDVHPTWVIAENVSALRVRGLTLVLQDLSSLGYCVEWHCIPAGACGAPHRRDRIWIIAHSQGGQVADSYGPHGEGAGCSIGVQEKLSDSYSGGCNGISQSHVANTISKRQQGQGQPGRPVRTEAIINREAVRAFYGRVKGFWEVEPDVGRVADGIPRRPHRLRQLGNAVIPQIPQLIGERIMHYERSAM